LQNKTILNHQDVSLEILLSIMKNHYNKIKEQKLDDSKAKPSLKLNTVDSLESSKRAITEVDIVPKTFPEAG